jgi:hypothetical protein
MERKRKKKNERRKAFLFLLDKTSTLFAPHILAPSS